MPDEGLFLQSALRILDGEKIYKDFDFLYNPGGVYINVLAFSIFGESMLASRIMALINSVIALGAISYIAKRLHLSYMLTGIAMIGYIFWGPGHINFVWPVMFCMTMALINGALFIAVKSKKKNTKLFFLTGIISALVFIIKQNFGLALFIANTGTFLLVKNFRTKNTVLVHIAGYVSVILLQVILFMSQGILDDYFFQIYHFTVVKIFQQGILNSPYPWEYTSSIIFLIPKILLYGSPLLIAGVSSLMLYKQKKDSGIIFFPIVTALYFILSIRPTTDFVHLSPLIALAIIPFLLLVHYERKVLIKRMYALLLICFVVMGGYTAYFSNYYRWSPPLKENTYFVQDPKVLLWTDKEQYNAINGITNYFQDNGKNEKYIFVSRYSPAWYLLLDKKNPTKYDYAEPSVIEKEDRPGMINTMKEKGVRYIIVDIPLVSDKTSIGSYIRDSYTQDAAFGKYSIWKRK